MNDPHAAFENSPAAPKSGDTFKPAGTTPCMGTTEFGPVCKFTNLLAKKLLTPLEKSHLAANLASVARNLQDGGFCTPAEVTPIAHVAKALAEQAAKECEK